MSDNTPLQKAYVNKEGVATLTCPYCDLVKTTTVEKFKGSRHVLRVKCACLKNFIVQLEFRKAYRKEIKLVGDYAILPDRFTVGRITVVNISKTGIGFQVLGGVYMKEGDMLQVKFNLDDVHNSLMEKKVIVRLIRDKYIGCEFAEQNTQDKALGFYLMV